MLDIIPILDKLQSFGYIRMNRQIGNYMSIYCPFHAGGQEHKPSCGVLLQDEVRGGQIYRAGWFHCFACGASYNLSEAVTEILKRQSIDKSGFDWLSENVPGFSVDNEFDYLLPQSMMEQITNKYTLDYIRSKSGIDDIKYVSEEELATYRYTVPYMYERKLTDEIIEKYDIGVDLNFIPPGRVKKVPCITFPVRDIQGRTLFLCRRSISGKMYNYPEGVSNSYQINQLRQLGIHEFVLAMDGDDAGRRAAKKLKKQLKDVAIVWAINMPDGKDLNDLNEDEFLHLYELRE